jgi:hypothetical protein
MEAMADEEMQEDAPDVTAAPPVVPPSAPRRRRWKWPLILLGGFVGVPVTILAVWTLIALTYTYSDGDRAGFVQKFSRKGWVCKTWEGELSMVNIPGQAQERWFFSVRNDSIAELLKKSLGSKVTLHYEEKRGLPTSCFGDTDYFVTGVREIP